MLLWAIRIMRVAIIGGGMAGLGAAYELVEQMPQGSAHEIYIFERSAELGGLASSFLVNGVALESFYHHMFPTYWDFFEVVPRIGLSDAIFFRPASTANFSDGAVYPFNRALDLLRYKPIPLVDRIRVGLVIAYLKMVKNPKRFESKTATVWLRRAFGRQAFDSLWYPLLFSKFGEHTNTIGMAWFWGRIFERPSRFGYFQGGFRAFVQGLEQFLTAAGVVIRTGAPVERIAKEGNHFQIRIGGHTDSFDHVIVAAPPAAFARMTEELLPTEYRELLKEYRYVGTICAILVLDRKLSPHYWTNIQEPGAPFVAVVEQTNFLPDDAYGGAHPVYLSRYLSPEDTLYRMSDEELWGVFLFYLKKVHPHFSEEFILQKIVFRAPATQPVIGANYEKHRPQYRTPIPGLWWVSMSHVYPWDRGTDHSFRAGRDLARELIASS